MDAYFWIFWSSLRLIISVRIEFFSPRWLKGFCFFSSIFTIRQAPRGTAKLKNQLKITNPRRYPLIIIHSTRLFRNFNHRKSLVQISLSPPIIVKFPAGRWIRNKNQASNTHYEAIENNRPNDHSYNHPNNNKRLLKATSIKKKKKRRDVDNSTKKMIKRHD